MTFWDTLTDSQKMSLLIANVDHVVWETSAQLAQEYMYIEEVN